MNLLDIQECANNFKTNYIEKFYIITTYDDKSFMLVGEKDNFPHLMGIPRKLYLSHGYKRGAKLYEDALNKIPINEKVIPSNIVPNSKIYNKALNFCNAVKLFTKNKCPMIINFDASKSTSRLNNVDKLIIDVETGYMMGWKDNKSIIITSEISLNKFCVSSWIDESNGSVKQKEKYMPSQDVELIHTILEFDASANLVNQKQIRYLKEQKIKILKSIERNTSNLLISKRNENNYVIIAKTEGIHCMINGIQY